MILKYSSDLFFQLFDQIIFSFNFPKTFIHFLILIRDSFLQFFNNFYQLLIVLKIKWQNLLLDFLPQLLLSDRISCLILQQSLKLLNLLPEILISSEELLILEDNFIDFLHVLHSLFQAVVLYLLDFVYVQCHGLLKHFISHW